MISTKKLLVILLGITMIIITFSSQAFAGSSVITDSHSSTVLNRTMNFNVYLPPSYSSNTSKYYPVLYLLHGMYGSNTDWTSNGMQSIVDNVGGKEMVIIMPNGFNAFYIKGYQSGIDYETYMHNELIPYVESKYRIDAADGRNRAIAGLSMGGYGATYYGFKYPEKFSSVYSMSGALEVSGTVDLSTVINKNKYPAYVMECGTEDTLVYQMNVSFHQKLQSAGIPHEYITRNGTHSWDFWKACLPKAIVFASKNFTEGAANTPTNKPTNTNTPVPTSTVKLVPEDINGDRAVNMTDVMLIASHFNTTSSGSNYDRNCDLNNDGAINMSDVMMIASKFNYAY